MIIVGYPIETIYLFALLFGGVLTFFYLFFSDVLEGIFEFLPDGILSPTTILAFITFIGASGYLFEKFTSFQSLLIFIFSFCIALICVLILHYFVLVPLSQAEESLAYREEDLIGRIGRVITSVPVDGFGEVLIEGKSGTIAKPAKSIDNHEIKAEQNVIVVDIQNGVLIVQIYQLLDYEKGGF